MLLKVKEFITYRFALLNSLNYIKYLRRKGVCVGDNTLVRFPRSTRIDLTRPSLITIGSNVDINKNFTIMTHDYSTLVFRNLYGEFLNSSGKVTIGNNVYFGTNVIVLKGVTIGNNCIIAAGFVVVKDIPDNTVAAGVPCRPLCSIEDYYKKRQRQCVDEAFEYARSIVERFNRRPVVEDFSEEFHLWCDSSNINDYPTVPYKSQLKDKEVEWLQTHKKTFDDFESFLKASGI